MGTIFLRDLCFQCTPLGMYYQSIKEDARALYRGVCHTKILKNLGQLWPAYIKLQGDFICYNSYLLTLGTLLRPRLN